MLYKDLIEKAMTMLDESDDLYVDMVNELDSWNGYSDGFRAYNMADLDDLFCGASASNLLKAVNGNNFNLNDDYFADTIYGLESIATFADMVTWYKDHTDTGELLDNIIDYYNHLYFYDHEFESIINDIVNYTEEDMTA